MAGRNTLESLGVLDIFNTVFAKNHSPMSLGVVVVFFENFVINLLCLIKFTFQTKGVCSIMQICKNIVITGGQGLLCAAILTGGNGFTRSYFKRAAAHLAFEN